LVARLLISTDATGFEHAAYLRSPSRTAFALPNRSTRSCMERK
jgi:hypothetical protein